MIDIFEVFEQSNKSDSHLKVSEDDYNPEIDEKSDSEDNSSDLHVKVNKMKISDVLLLEKFNKNNLSRYLLLFFF